MTALVVLGGTIVFATASAYYLSRLVSAKRDVNAKGELAIHNRIHFDAPLLFLHLVLSFYLVHCFLALL